MAMRCPYCGFENPDKSSFCNSCGKEIGAPSATTKPAGSRYCVSCGRSFGVDANVCPYCGYDYRVQWMRPQVNETISSGMRILFYVLSLLFPIVGFIIGVVYYSKGDPESKHVGKMCAMLGVVGIFVSVALAALLYLMVLGFGGLSETPTSALSRGYVTNGVKFTIVVVSSSSVYWADLRITLMDSHELVSWSPQLNDLESGFGSGLEFPAVSLGSLMVTCKMYDVAGNGIADPGDYFTLTTEVPPTFSSATTYQVAIVFEPTGSTMTSSSFTG